MQHFCLISCIHINYRSHKVIGVANCSREEMRSAPTREKPMTLELIEKLKGEEGEDAISI